MPKPVKEVSMLKEKWIPLNKVKTFDFCNESSYYFLWILQKSLKVFYDKDCSSDTRQVASFVLFGNKTFVPSKTIIENQFPIPREVMGLITPVHRDIIANDYFKGHYLEFVALFQDVILDKKRLCPLDEKSTTGFLIDFISKTKYSSTFSAEHFAPHVDIYRKRQSVWESDIDKLESLGVSKYLIIPRLFACHLEKANKTDPKLVSNDLLSRVNMQLGQSDHNERVVISDIQDDEFELLLGKKHKEEKVDEELILSKKTLEEMNEKEYNSLLSAVEQRDKNKDKNRPSVNEEESLSKKEIESLKRKLSHAQKTRDQVEKDLEKERAESKSIIDELRKQLEDLDNNRVNHDACICEGGCLNEAKAEKAIKEEKEPNPYTRDELKAFIALCSKRSSKVFSSFWSTFPDHDLLVNLLESSYSPKEIFSKMDNRDIFSELCAKIYTEHMIRVALETGIGSSRTIKKILHMPEDNSVHDMITRIFNASTIDPTVPQKIGEIHTMVKNLSTMQVSEKSGVQAFSNIKPPKDNMPKQLLDNLIGMSNNLKPVDSVSGGQSTRLGISTTQPSGRSTTRKIMVLSDD